MVMLDLFLDTSQTEGFMQFSGGTITEMAVMILRTQGRKVFK